jgi:hypothetical protein
MCLRSNAIDRCIQAAFTVRPRAGCMQHVQAAGCMQATSRLHAVLQDCNTATINMTSYLPIRCLSERFQSYDDENLKECQKGK